jgi:hypothetical protein
LCDCDPLSCDDDGGGDDGCGDECDEGGGEDGCGDDEWSLPLLPEEVPEEE